MIRELFTFICLLFELIFAVTIKIINYLIILLLVVVTLPLLIAGMIKFIIDKEWEK